MNIQILSATGSGPTKLAAFDHALSCINLHDFNLITLSSVIPPLSTILKKDTYISQNFTKGNRLYVVLSTISTSNPQETITAGLGWAQNTTDQSGIFVEIHGTNKKIVQQQIKNTLNSMLIYRKGDFQQGYITKSIEYTNQPVCALAIAVFSQQSW